MSTPTLFSGSYQVYTALVDQAGVAAPVPIILENSLGAIVWTRTSAGIFVGTLTGAFTQCWLNVSNNLTGFGAEIQLYRTSNNTVELITGSGGFPTDGLLNNTAIEIRVY